MSHFTYMKTHFQNLFYLEKALNRLSILYKTKKTIINNSKSELYNINLVIPQSNGSDIEFHWNGEEYELIFDKSFWKQSSSIETFINKIAQQYAGELIINESQKIGFQPIKYQQNKEDNSNTLILERWVEG